MNSTTISKYRHIVLRIDPAQRCWQCHHLTNVAFMEGYNKHDWSLRPVCPLHGYAERDGRVGFALRDEHDSVRRFLIESQQLQGVDPHSIHIRKCSTTLASPYGYEPVDPFDVFADERTVKACHIPDACWQCTWNVDQGQRKYFVVWNYDLIEFRSYPVIDVKL